MNQNFSQTIPVRFADPDRIIELLREWDLVQATGDLTGHMGTRVLADRAHPGQYVVIADFSGVCDMGVRPHWMCSDVPRSSAATSAESSAGRNSRLAPTGALSRPQRNPDLGHPSGPR